MGRAEGREFREVLRTAVEKLWPEDPCALLFSGGTDSLTVLWTLLDLGITPTCYTFRLQRKRSKDSKVARLSASYFNFALVEVVVPDQHPEELAADLGWLVSKMGTARKTHVEVLWCFWRLLTHPIVERQVWTGLQADTLYGTSQKAAIRCWNMSAASFARERRRLIKEPDTEGLDQMDRLCRLVSAEHAAPYARAEVRDWTLSRSWKELNVPKKKMPARRAFASEFAAGALYRNGVDGIQAGSGVTAYLEELRDCPAVNTEGRRSMTKLYEDLGRRHGWRR